MFINHVLFFFVLHKNKTAVLKLLYIILKNIIKQLLFKHDKTWKQKTKENERSQRSMG